MQIWPAIDLLGGRCVRLAQGDYDRETVYGDDAVAMAQRWVDQGAQFLHLVDLDGARRGRPMNRDCVEAIVAATDVECEVGGGVRDEAAIEQLLEAGVRRVVVGTRALKQPEWFREMCQKYPGKLVLGIDARDGHVATEGWLETSDCEATTLATQFDGALLAAIVYTDIATDGMLSGPNLDAMRKMQQTVNVAVVASGGVSSTEDVRRLAQIPMAGCIVGKALYEGRLTVTEALAAAAEAEGMIGRRN